MIYKYVLINFLVKVLAVEQLMWLIFYSCSNVLKYCLYSAWLGNIICPELNAFVHYDLQCCGLVLYLCPWGGNPRYSSFPYYEVKYPLNDDRQK